MTERIIRRRSTPEPLSSNVVGALLRRRSRPEDRNVHAEPQEFTTPQETVEVPDQDSEVLMDILKRARFEPRAARDDTYLHVSDLLAKCIRKIAIVEQHKLNPAPQRLSLMDILTFAVGDTIHDVIKGKAAIGSPQQVWGNWKCKCGTTRTTEPCTFSDINARQQCPACGGALTEYVEVPMVDEELGIVGTPDLLLLLAAFEAFYVTELKSIAHEQWKELVRPKPEHVLQVLFYWYLMKKLGYRMMNRVSILYVTKGYLFTGSPCKEFMFNPEEILGRLDMYLDLARELKQSRENGTLPARITCVSDKAPEAKKCEVCSICFGGADAAPKKVSVASALRRPAPLRR